MHSGLPALRAEADPGLLASTSDRQASLQPNLRMQKAKAHLPTGYVCLQSEMHCLLVLGA